MLERVLTIIIVIMRCRDAHVMVLEAFALVQLALQPVLLLNVLRQLICRATRYSRSSQRLMLPEAADHSCQNPVS